MLIAKGLVRGVFQVGLFAAALLIPAGTWDWPRALQLLGLYGLLMFVSTIALARLAPASLEARIQPAVANSQPSADRVATLLLALSLLTWLVFIPVDVFRIHLLPPPPFIVSLFGAALFIFGFGIMALALYQNAFAAPIVRDQSERNQILIDFGLYGRVRHPPVSRIADLFYRSLIVAGKRFKPIPLAFHLHLPGPAN